MPSRDGDEVFRRVVAIGVGLLIFLASPARAALFVLLDREQGPPGALIAGRTGGDGAFGRQVPPLPAYLVPSRIVGGLDETVSNEQALRANPDLVRVGRLVVDAAGNGSTQFRVPDVRPGQYQLFVLCRGCAQHSAGRTFVPVADFRVTDPLGRYRRRTVPWVPIAAAVMVGLLLGAAAWERGRRTTANRWG